MTIYHYDHLQNGSDIRGVALAGVPGEPVTLDIETVQRLARGFLFWLTHRTEKKPADLTISVGRDPRLSGPEIAAAFLDALQPYGCRLLDAGLASTPAMFMSTVFPDYDCDAAVMVTASHLPRNRNGLKFFTRDGGLDKGDITDILTFAESDSMLGNLRPGTPQPPTAIPLLDTYAAHLRNLIVSQVGTGPQPLSGMKITVDAGNGAGGFFADRVLAPLGADVSSSQFLEPDGQFPHHAPNPEDRQAMASVCAQVRTAGADLGLIFDTDVDRSAAVDEQGHEISRNGIVALAAALIADAHPGTTVVTDSITSPQLTAFLEQRLGLRHLRYKRGYRNVINRAIALCDSGVDSQLAIETSGHAAYRENYFLDDGAYLAVKIVIQAARLHAQGQGISAVIADLQEPVEAEELRFPITAPDFSAYGDRILQDLQTLTESGMFPGAQLVTPNYEGVRIAFDTPQVQGWLLLRKSLHDPLMPLNIESDTPGGCAVIRRLLLPILSGYDLLDTRAL